jgi:hypothetical protein
VYIVIRRSSPVRVDVSLVYVPCRHTFSIMNKTDLSCLRLSLAACGSLLLYPWQICQLT